MDVKIDIPELPSLIQRYGAQAVPVIRDELTNAGNRSGIRVQNAARQKVRVRTGRLRNSVTYHTTTFGDTIETKIGTNVPYGRYLEEGTGIYGPRGAPIVPVRARFLVFEVGGRTVFARSVRGTPGDKWLTGSFRAQVPAIRREFADALKRILARLTRGG